MHTRILNIWTNLRANYWLLPALMAIGAGVLALLALTGDRLLPDVLLEAISINEADGARSILSTIAGSMIGVAGVVFSITLVALTLASQQYGPRLLDNFMRDTGNQIVLGTFIATFIYCLLVLGAVNGSESAGFIPRLSVVIGIVLGMTSLAVLIYYIHHIPESIRVFNILSRIANDLDSTIERVFPEELAPDEAAPADTAADEIPADYDRSTPLLYLQRSGYLQTIDHETLLHVAQEHDLLLKLHVRPGDFLSPGRPVLAVPGLPDLAEQTIARLRAAFVIGTARTALQDLDFLFDKFSEMAMRALSPGINDPITATMALDWMGAALGKLARRHMPTPYLRDADGALRVITRPENFVTMVDTAFEQVRHYAAGDLVVLTHMVRTIGTIGHVVRRQADRDALHRHLRLIENQVRRLDQDTWHMQPYREQVQAAMEALDAGSASDPAR